MKLSKQRKLVVIIIGGALIIALIAAAIIEWAVPRYSEKNEVYYSFKSKGGIGYKVYLKPNIMYETEYLEEDRYYVFKYVDYVELEFVYDYKGSAPAEIKTDYVATASLQGLHGADSEVLWSKELVLVPGKTKQLKESSYRITEKALVNLQEFQDLRDTLFMDSEVNTPVVLNVVFNVHTRVSTSEGKLEDSVNPGLIIPIGETVFRIDGQREIAGEKKIEKTLRELVPTNKTKVILYFIFVVVLTVMLVFVARMEEAVPMDPFDRTVAAIFKEYGERMAGMEHAISYMLIDVINVNSIEDMVKIADEVGQPVFYYKVDDRSERKIEFYVFDNNRIYYMVLFGEIRNNGQNGNLDLYEDDELFSDIT